MWPGTKIPGHHFYLMPAFSHLIVGLGNPGDEYVGTRHNIGFMVLDEIAARYHCQVWKKKFRSVVATADNFILAKPQTFMNLSGEAAIEAVQFYQFKPNQVIVIHDDLDLLPGQIKIKQGGGAGGHNGLKSLDSHLGKDYWRVRIGIGRPMTEQGIAVKGDAVSSYVLSPFSRSDRNWVEPLLSDISSNFGLLLAGDYQGYAAKLSKSEQS